MKDSSGKTELTFGEFVAAVYAAWGVRRAPGLVQLAVDAHLVEFLGDQRFVISLKEPPGSSWPRDFALFESQGDLPNWMAAGVGELKCHRTADPS